MNNYFVDFATLSGHGRIPKGTTEWYDGCFAMTDIGLQRYGNEIIYDVLRILDEHVNVLNAKAAIKQHFGLPR
jgi:hypothetical protein